MESGYNLEDYIENALTNFQQLDEVRKDLRDDVRYASVNAAIKSLHPKLTTIFDKMENVFHFAEMSYTSCMVNIVTRKIIFKADIVPILKQIPDCQRTFKTSMTTFFMGGFTSKFNPWKKSEICCLVGNVHV